jgi:DNA-binding NarL/FixJ family response regulator
MKSILILTNQLALGQGLSEYIMSQYSLFGRTVVSRVEEAKKVVGNERFRFIVLDLHLLGVEGPHMIAALHRAARHAGIILVLSGTESPAYIHYLLDRPIIGLLNRQCSMNEFLVCIEEADRRNVYIPRESDSIVSRQVQPGEEMPGIYLLSKRELEIARFVAQGLTSVDIALQSGLSPKTVEIHRYNIYKKLRLKNRIGLVRMFAAYAGSIGPMSDMLTLKNHPDNPILFSSASSG